MTHPLTRERVVLIDLSASACAYAVSSAIHTAQRTAAMPDGTLIDRVMLSHGVPRIAGYNSQRFVEISV